MHILSVVVMCSANMATMYFSSSSKIKYRKSIIQTRLLIIYEQLDQLQQPTSQHEHISKLAWPTPSHASA